MHLLEPGLLVADALEPYAHVDRRRGTGSCWVMAHMVGGLDRSSAVGGRVSELSDPPDQQLFLRMRSFADVVMVGAQTVGQEGYGPVRLTETQLAARRRSGKRPNPVLAVVTRSLELDWSAVAFASPSLPSRTLVITCDSADPRKLGRAREVSDVISPVSIESILRLPCGCCPSWVIG